MRRLLLFLLLSIPAAAMQPATGWCGQGGFVVVTGGVNSTTKVMRSFPSCTITVYLAGTSTPATIYSDNSSTPLANPFAANISGQWTFYAADAAYDVQLSGAGIPTPFRTPYTLVSAVVTAPAFSAILTGVNTSATMTVGAGATLTYSSTGIINASRILGVTLTSLTGVVYMTAGVPSVATGTCNSGTVVYGDGHCAALGSTYYQTIQLGTTPQTQRLNLNFPSTNFTAADSSGSNRTTIDLAANISANAATASALDHNPSACGANTWVTDLSAAVVLTCTQPAAANLSNGVSGSGNIILKGSPTIMTPTIIAPVISSITNTGTETLPVTTGGLPVVIACGATTGSASCANTNVGATSQIYFGAATLASNSAVITLSPGYTSTSTFFCVGNDKTTRANPVDIASTSATTITITNTTGASDLIYYHCVGY